MTVWNNYYYYFWSFIDISHSIDNNLFLGQIYPMKYSAEHNYLNQIFTYLFLRLMAYIQHPSSLGVMAVLE